MDYTEFKSAANRHLYTCKKLLNAAANQDENPDGRDDVLWNTYYLSGYVIETMLKYYYFYHYATNQYNLQGVTNIDIFFNHNVKKIFTHDLNLLSSEIRNLLGGDGNTDIPFVTALSQSPDLIELKENWHESIRYEKKPVSINYSKLNRYITEIESFYQAIDSL